MSLQTCLKTFHKYQKLLKQNQALNPATEKIVDSHLAQTFWIKVIQDLISGIRGCSHPTLFSNNKAGTWVTSLLSVNELQ